MRRPDDVAKSPRATTHRRRRWIIIAVIVLIAVIASLRTFAVFYTDALWFSAVRLHSVWRSLFEIKAGLMITFCVIFAALLLASLTVAERLAPRGQAADAEDDFVRRYQEIVGPYSRWIRAAVVIILSLIVGSQALGQWQNWIFFRNGVSFGKKDALWHKNVGFFVFKLPFETFIVHWALVALIVIFLVTVSPTTSTAGSGSSRADAQRRPAGQGPHLGDPRRCMALVKAVGYYLAALQPRPVPERLRAGCRLHRRPRPAAGVEAAHPGSRPGRGHPVLIFNIRRRGWALPVLGRGLVGLRGRGGRAPSTRPSSRRSR